MREWERKLRAGYSIRSRLRRGRDGYPERGPGLFNPEGEFVQNVRRDTVEKLWALGILTRSNPAVWAGDGDDAGGEDG